jgi:hypothetical protein
MLPAVTEERGYNNHVYAAMTIAIAYHQVLKITLWVEISIISWYIVLAR